MENRIHTVIFDLDGTLSDSAVLTVAAFNNILTAQGIPVPSLENIRMATGYSAPEFYYILFPNYPRGQILEIGRLVEQEESRMLPSIGDRVLFSGSRELLKYLYEHGIRLYIASTGARDHVFPILEETGIIGFFDTISCGRPDKTEMLRELTHDRNKTGYVMVGDMKKDHESARANGIFSVGACYGYCRRELTEFDSYIDTPLELLRVLNIREK